MDNNEFSEKRAYARFPVTIPAFYLNEQLNRTVHTATYDISTEGISILADKPLPEGLTIDIYMEMADDGEKIFRKGIIVWSQQSETNKFRIGIKLEDNIKPIPLALRTVTCHRNL